MTEQMNRVYYEPDSGSLFLDRNGIRERVILLRRGFWDGFLPEIASILGDGGISLVMRKLVERVGLSDVLTEKATFRTLIDCFDRRILPLSREDSSLPESVTWGPHDREVVVFGDTIWILQDVFTIQQLKVVLSELLDDNGANAIMRSVSRKGGLSIWDTALKNYGWTNLDTLIASQDKNVFQYTFSIAGWSITRSCFRPISSDDYVLLVKCANTFESEGVVSDKPVCTILTNYMEGFLEGVLSRLSEREKSVVCREVKCRAQGDDYCAFVLASKDKRDGILDWDFIMHEYEVLDSTLTVPVAA